MWKKSLTVLALTVSLLGCQPMNSAPVPTSPTTEDDKTFYTLGALVGRNLKLFNLTPAELAMVQQGLADQATGKELLVKMEEYGPKVDQLASSRRQAAMTAEKEKAKGYLEKAATEAGAQKKESGLIYIPVSEGTGAQPTAADTVKVHYTGTLTDGTKFDSSVDRGQPAEFPLGGVIRCWTEGLQLMKVGGKAKLVCPSDIAYGDMGRPPKIPGGATLLFEVELLEVQASSAPPAMPGMPDMPHHSGGESK